MAGSLQELKTVACTSNVSSSSFQGGGGLHVTGPQLLASVVPRPGATMATANLGLPGASVPNAGGDNAAYYQQLRLSQQGTNPAAALVSSGAALLLMYMRISNASLNLVLQ